MQMSVPKAEVSNSREQLPVLQRITRGPKAIEEESPVERCRFVWTQQKQYKLPSAKIDGPITAVDPWRTMEGGLVCLVILFFFAFAFMTLTRIYPCIVSPEY